MQHTKEGKGGKVYITWGREIVLRVDRHEGGLKSQRWHTCGGTGRYRRTKLVPDATDARDAPGTPGGRAGRREARIFS